MNQSNKFSPEVCERAVRMVLEHRAEYPSLWAAVESIEQALYERLVAWYHHKHDAAPGVYPAGRS